MWDFYGVMFCSSAHGVLVKHMWAMEALSAPSLGGRRLSFLRKALSDCSKQYYSEVAKLEWTRQLAAHKVGMVLACFDCKQPHAAACS